MQGADEMVADIQVNDTVIYSEQSLNEDQSKKANKFRDQREEERIVRQFKILSPKEIEQMLSGLPVDKPTQKTQSEDDFQSSHSAVNQDEPKH
jgi:hypothetical protein